MRDLLTLTVAERLALRAAEAARDAEVVFQMDEDTFRAFYDRTARPVWMYLARMTGDRQAADDLLQETYYRFLRARREYASDAHRRNYLFRIATNLVRDGHRVSRVNFAPLPEEDAPNALRTVAGAAEQTERRADLTRALARLKPRERDLLWLAYAEGSSHQEIAESLGLRTGSIKLLLYRARHRLAAMLNGS
jgi:RNA polymerase sigma-70 factor (ECF subfamily)